MNVDFTRIRGNLITRSKNQRTMSIASNIVDTVGNTPLIKLNKVTEGIDCEIFLKAEFFNPLLQRERPHR